MRIAAWVIPVCLLWGHAWGGTPQPTKTGEGRLVTDHDGAVVEVPLEHTDVKIRIDGFVADTTVTQHFRNPYAAKIEAVYLFPLPTGAGVNDMTIATGGRTIRGSIMERAKATRVYETARDAGRIAALLTQERPNLFTQSIANLEPAATIDVTLHYVERLAYDSGGYEVAFPMVAGPRYVPASAKHDAAAVQPAVLPPGVRSSHDISLSVDIDAGVPIEGITSSSHQIAIDHATPAHASVHIQPTDTIPNKDFVLRYQVAGMAPQFGVLGYRDGGEGSFLFVAQPPASPQASDIAPREIVFVLDTSSSMRGAPLDKAKDVIRKALFALRPDDTFQIVRFDDRASALGPSPIANKPHNVELTLQWLAALDAGGATEMVTGIEAALAVPHDPQRLRIVAFLTDGYVGNEDQILASVGAHIGDARLFCFGVGSAVNRYLLEEMATIGRGAAQFVRPDEDTAAAVGAFERRIDAPVLTDLRIDWGGLAVRDVVPQALPDLFAGEPLVLSGHYASAGQATVMVRGKQAGRAVEFAVPVTLADKDATRPAIATVWARQRIAELSRRLVRKADPAIVQDIIGLSLAHHLLTQYTAFVAVDDSHVTKGGAATRVAVPVEVPDGVRDIQTSIYGVLLGNEAGDIGWGTIGVGSYGTIGHGYGGGGSGYGVGGGYGGMHAHVAAMPTVTIGAPVVLAGSLDKAIIRRYVKRNIEQIRYCYEKALLGHPKLQGTVSVQFFIGDSGTVTTSAASGVDPDVSSCVAGVIKSIEFPHVPDGGGIQVSYPFTFLPAKETQP